MATLTFEQYKAFGMGNGLAMRTSEIEKQTVQRSDAIDAYLAAFPLRIGQETHRSHMDAAIQYGNYQVCRTRGWVSTSLPME